MPYVEDIQDITGYYNEALRPYDGPEIVSFADGIEDLINSLIEPRERWPVLNRDEREPFSPQKRAIIYQRDGECCWYCYNGGPLHIDHIIPRTAFPVEQLHIADRSDNLVTACQSCNEAKSNYEHPITKRPGATIACWYCQNPSFDYEYYEEYRNQDYAGIEAPPEMRYQAYCGRHGNTTFVPEVTGWII